MGQGVCGRIAVVIPGILVQPQAALDAKEIYSYLFDQNPAVARRFNEAVADTLIDIRDDPGLGIRWHSRDGRLSDLRWKKVTGFKNYLVFYQANNGGIVVVRILHGARDLEAVLEG